MRLTLLNLTEQTILVSTSAVSIASDHEHISIQPSESLDRILPTARRKRRKASILLSTIFDYDDPLWSLVVSLQCSCMSGMRASSSWKTLQTSSDCPWRLFLFRTSAKERKLVIIPNRNLASFLGEMPDSLSLASLLLPGTHDALAFYGYPISQCQSPQTPLAVQLRSGIRVLDVRLAIVNGKLIAYHGVYPQRSPFSNILDIVHEFLTSEEGKNETIIMSIKQEDFTIYPAEHFSALVREEMLGSLLGPSSSSSSKEKGLSDSGMLYLDNRVPLLGEVRGKMVLFSRFGANGNEWEGGLDGMGIHPLVWPDSSKVGFEWDCNGTTVRTHDWYAIPTFLSIPEKVQLSSRILLPPEDGSHPLNITYFSAATFPLALPPVVAKGFGMPPYFGIDGVNVRVGRWLLGLLGSESTERRYKTHKFGTDMPLVTKAKSFVTTTSAASILESAECVHDSHEEPRIRGWTFLDYFEEPEAGLVPLLVECNWRGRKSGEEGWP